METKTLSNLKRIRDEEKGKDKKFDSNINKLIKSLEKDTKRMENTYKICKTKKCKDKKNNIGNPVTEKEIEQILEYWQQGHSKIESLVKFYLIDEKTQNKISNLDIKGFSNREIWEEIELHEALEKLPGREAELKGFGKEIIEKIEKSKLGIVYKIHFRGKLIQQITKKELIDLWTKGKIDDIKLIPENKPLKEITEKLGEFFKTKKINIEVQDNEFSKIFKEIVSYNMLSKGQSTRQFNQWVEDYKKLNNVSGDEAIKKIREYINTAEDLTFKK